MSATKIKAKRDSAWAHKQLTESAATSESRPPASLGVAVIEMTKLWRSLDGHVCTPTGHLSDDAYEDARARNPGAGLPALADIPYRGDLGTALALNNLMTGLPPQKKLPIQ